MTRWDLRPLVFVIPSMLWLCVTLKWLGETFVHLFSWYLPCCDSVWLSYDSVRPSSTCFRDTFHAVTLCDFHMTRYELHQLVFVTLSMLIHCVTLKWLSWNFINLFPWHLPCWNSVWLSNDSVGPSSTCFRDTFHASTVPPSIICMVSDVSCLHLSRSLFLYFNYFVNITAGGPESPRAHM